MPMTVINCSTVKTYTYNNQGLPSVETVKIGNDTFKINRSYDTRGNDRGNSYYKNGTLYQKINYVYDNINRLTGVHDVNVSTGVSSMKAQYGYDKNDNNTIIHYGNGGATIINYNAANLPTRLYNSNGSTICDDFKYTYRLDGNISSKVETCNNITNNVQYNYDSTGRLIYEKANDANNDTDYTLSYTYDNAGNRNKMTLSSNDVSYNETYSYDNNNRLIGTVKNYGTTSAYTNYTYDKNGNQTKVEKYSKNNDGFFKLGVVSASYKGNWGEEKFTYNSLNQLTSYESTNGKYNGKVGLSAEYKYMANGYRLSKSVNGLETRYIWDRDNIIAELNSVNVVSQKYYRGYNLICDDSNRYYMHNAHGDVVDITNGTEYHSNYYSYNAFGTNKYFDDTYAVNKWGYCDQLMDFETGNYYMRARYYNPNTGRFISEDPIKDGLNWYSILMHY